MSGPDRPSSRSYLTLAKSLIGKRGLGLRHEDAKPGVDYVWLGDEEGLRTSFERVKAARYAGGGFVTLEPYGPPQASQGATSSCVGELLHRVTATKESILGLSYDPPSPRAIYRQSVAAHTRSGVALADDGTSIRVALSQLAKNGSATLAQWPRSFRDVLAPVPAVIRSNGYNRRGLRYEFIVALSTVDELDMVDAAIRSKNPVGFGWNVTERYMNHRGAAPYDARLRKSDVVRGGHAQDQITTRDEHGIVRLGNSWGDWADGGKINVIADTMTRRDLVICSGWERVASHA